MLSFVPKFYGSGKVKDFGHVLLLEDFAARGYRVTQEKALHNPGQVDEWDA